LSGDEGFKKRKENKKGMRRKVHPSIIFFTKISSERQQAQHQP
jgi:hypothetical protein